VSNEPSRGARNSLPPQTKDEADVELGLHEQIPLSLADNRVPAVGIGVIFDGTLQEARVFGELRQGEAGTNQHYL
jgi:hypothetical protein